MTAERKAQEEAVAVQLGFQNAELMLAYFKKKLMDEGLYEALVAKAAEKATKH